MYTPNFDPRDSFFYNPIINSNMNYWQRVVGTAITRTQASNSYGLSADRVFGGTVGGGTARSFTFQRSTDVPPSKFYCPYSLQITNNTAVSSLAAGEWATVFQQALEGQSIAPFSNSTMTFGVWIKTSVAGTYSVAFRRNSLAKSYVTTVTVSASNTWEYKTVLLPWDTLGASYNFGTSNDLDFSVGGLTGTTFHAPSLNTWANGNFFSHPSCTNWMAVSGAVMRFAQPQLRLGARSLEFMRDGYLPFALSLAQELLACQRYYEKTYNVETLPGTAANFLGSWSVVSSGTGAGGASIIIPYKSPKRISSPTVTVYNTTTGGAGTLDRNGTSIAATVDLLGENSVRIANSVATIDTAYHYAHITSDAEI